MSDTDATQERQDVVADVDEIIEHVINANMLSMPYDVYSELFDAVDGLGVKIEKFQAENAKLRGLIKKYMSAARYLCGHKGGCDTCNLDCASYFGAEPHGWDCARMLLDREAHELGIEVPE